MEKELFEIFYTNELGQPSQKLIISSQRELDLDIEKFMKENNIEKRPAVVAYKWISGYYIQPMSDTLDSIAKGLEEKAFTQYQDFASRIAYLEALRDVLKVANTNWQSMEHEKNEAVYKSFRETLGGSNIPQGYNSEGDRL